MQRFFIPKDSFNQEAVVISDPLIIHQIKNVLRMKAGGNLTVLDNSGIEFDTEILEIGKKTVLAKILQERKNLNESDKDIFIYQAMPKQMSKFEVVLQKCTEIGVKGFVPLFTERTEREKLSKKDRLEAIIREAGEQSGRGVLPILTEEIIFENALEKVKSEQNILPYESEKSIYLKDIIGKLDFSKRINIFIGPEGGITPKEAKLAKNAGFHIVSLGRLILRTETVGIAMAGRMML